MSPNLDTTTDRIAASVTRPKVVIALLLVALASGAVLASVTLEEQNPDELRAVQGTMNDSTNLSVSDINVTYTGFTADSVDVVISNDDESNDHTVNVSVEVLDGDSEVTSPVNEGPTTIPAGTTHTVTVTLDEEIFDFDTINVLVRELS